ncbi:MAG: 16S rRNA (cytosine(967)-C(5))-methyltransferase [Elainellaceae cyanobacterium]
MQHGAFADIALDRALSSSKLETIDRHLATELVYGTIRRQRTLDALIDQFAKKPAQQQPPDLRLILHLGLYQLRYLNHIPPSAAVNTTVDLAKTNGFQGLAGFVNGILRQYVRSVDAAPASDPLLLPDQPITQLGILHSFPDWIVQIWIEEFGYEETAQLCQWLNRSPRIDLRVNPLRSSLEQVEAAMQAAGITVHRVPPLPQALRLAQGVGAIQQLPGFAEGWWTVQDCSAQLVSHFLAPQPGEVVIDACAAPGGKTTHLAELMQDQGKIWAIDRHASRLKKLQQNIDRLQLQSIQQCTDDSRHLPQFTEQADRVLLDAPCSGLGTLHRHADARWRQTPEKVRELAQLQTELLNHTATWVKPGGYLVYATCTLHPLENEAVIQQFLADHPNWTVNPPTPPEPAAQWATEPGWLKVLPHHHDMDGFFMVRLQRSTSK